MLKAQCLKKSAHHTEGFPKDKVKKVFFDLQMLLIYSAATLLGTLINCSLTRISNRQ